MSDVHISATEAGLLSVVERQGELRAKRVLDLHNDALELERREILSRLEEAGLVREAYSNEAEIAYVITAAGRAVLAELDARHG